MVSTQQVAAEVVFDERSAGGIVYRYFEGKLQWLVIKTLANRAERKYKLFAKPPRLLYKFPKGHVMEKEFLKAAALREVEEEAWVKAKIISKLGSNDYIIWDKDRKQKIIKRVTFFLMEYTVPTNTRYFDAEGVVGKEWLSFEEAYKVLAYSSEKVLLKKAFERVGTKK